MTTDEEQISIEIHKATSLLNELFEKAARLGIIVETHVESIHEIGTARHTAFIDVACLKTLPKKRKEGE